MIIQCDTRQKLKHHTLKEQFFIGKGIELLNSKMLVGDYCIPSNGNIVVDTKGSISELYGNLIQQHERFHNECVLAQQCGIELYILIENKDGVKKVEDIINWKNPQLIRYRKQCRDANEHGRKEPKPPASNEHIMRIMSSMSRKYGVKFLFCSPAEAGEIVLKILTKENE